MSLADAQTVFFLNFVLSLTCSICTVFGTWPFQGLFQQWFWPNASYSWTTHAQMVWFSVGCIGLCSINVSAWALLTDASSEDAFQLVYILNIVMHGLWGLENLFLFVRIKLGTDKGTINEFRTSIPMVGWSALGSCGSAAVRNAYALCVGKDGLDPAVIAVTWAWEWIALVLILCDFGRFLVKHHKWGSNVLKTEKQLIAQTSMDPTV